MSKFEIRISEIGDDEDEDKFFGPPKITVKYRPPGSRTWNTRQAGEDKGSNEAMLQRIVDEVLRRAFDD